MYLVKQSMVTARLLLFRALELPQLWPEGHLVLEQSPVCWQLVICSLCDFSWCFMLDSLQSGWGMIWVRQRSSPPVIAPGELLWEAKESEVRRDWNEDTRVQCEISSWWTPKRVSGHEGLRRCPEGQAKESVLYHVKRGIHSALLTFLSGHVEHTAPF